MDWKALNESHNSQMIVIGDYYFNKFLTLDIENKLMMYLLSAESVTQLNNRRSNPQRKYFMSDQFENVLEGVWQTLRKKGLRFSRKNQKLKILRCSKHRLSIL